MSPSPRLRATLRPVSHALGLIFVIFAVLTAGAIVRGDPTASAMSAVALLVVGPVLYWLGRPAFNRASNTQALFLWGAAVAVPLGVIIELLLGIVMTNSTVMATVGAPIVEESLKLLGVIAVVRFTKAGGRLRIDNFVDAVVAAGWVGIGFAIVEDMLYLVGAQHTGGLTSTFIARDLITPFGHPLFASFGAVGYWWYRRTGQWWWAGIGLAMGITVHGTFNGTATMISDHGFQTDEWVLIAVVASVLLSVYGTAFVLRRHHVRADLSIGGLMVSGDLAGLKTYYQAWAWRMSLPRKQRGDADILLNRVMSLSTGRYRASERETLVADARAALGVLGAPGDQTAVGIGDPGARTGVLAAHPTTRSGVVAPAPAAVVTAATTIGWHAQGERWMRWWDGTAWTSLRWWDGTAWIEVAPQDGGQ